jgi:hypothetical protein
MTSGLQNAETTNQETTNQERPELSNIQGLSTDDQLGLLWVLYEHMGESITPAAPGAADEQFTQRLLEDVKAMEQADQLTFMRYSENNKLLFWYELAEEMAAGTVVPVPDDYELSSSASEVFNALAALDFNAQITVLRHAALNMGA